MKHTKEQYKQAKSDFLASSGGRDLFPPRDLLNDMQSYLNDEHEQEQNSNHGCVNWLLGIVLIVSFVMNRMYVLKYRPNLADDDEPGHYRTDPTFLHSLKIKNLD